MPEMLLKGEALSQARQLRLVFLLSGGVWRACAMLSSYKFIDPKKPP